MIKLEKCKIIFYNRRTLYEDWSLKNFSPVVHNFCTGLTIIFVLEMRGLTCVVFDRNLVAIAAHFVGCFAAIPARKGEAVNYACLGGHNAHLR